MDTLKPDYRKCRQKAHSTQKDNCVKIEQGNDNLEDVINFNGERDGWYFHHTTEIEAPYGKFIQLQVSDFNIGNRTLELNKSGEELCGYGSIFVFTGEGDMAAMHKVVEFCGATDNPIVDYNNLLYPGKFTKFLRFFVRIFVRNFTIFLQFFTYFLPNFYDFLYEFFYKILRFFYKILRFFYNFLRMFYQIFTHF
mgnify:CR=1 FL=1